MSRARLAAGAALVAASSILSTAVIMDPLTETVARVSAAGRSAADDPDYQVPYVTLAGGRMFACSSQPYVACLEAALAASIVEAAELRTAAGSCTCRESARVEGADPRGSVGDTGAFCISAADPVGGGNDIMDAAIAAALCDVAGPGASVVDLGCGLGQYRAPAKACGLSWRGFDGSPAIEEVTGGRVRWADLTVPIDVGGADWVLSLEVGEHLPSRLALVYVDNLARHARRGVVMSWATPGQVGMGHINNQPNEVVYAALAERGLALDVARTAAVRAASTVPWFQGTAMVFRRGE